MHTLYLDTVKTSVTRQSFKNKTDLHVSHVGIRGGQLTIYSISKISKRSNGSYVRWKAVPQMCPTVSETTFQKIGTRLRQSQFVINIPKSIVRAEGLK